MTTQTCPEVNAGGRAWCRGLPVPLGLLSWGLGTLLDNCWVKSVKKFPRESWQFFRKSKITKSDSMSESQIRIFRGALSMVLGLRYRSDFNKLVVLDKF